jgi:hypothetical protein
MPATSAGMKDEAASKSDGSKRHDLIADEIAQ